MCSQASRHRRHLVSDVTTTGTHCHDIHSARPALQDQHLVVLSSHDVSVNQGETGSSSKTNFVLLGASLAAPCRGHLEENRSPPTPQGSSRLQHISHHNPCVCIFSQCPSSFNGMILSEEGALLFPLGHARKRGLHAWNAPGRTRVKASDEVLIIHLAYVPQH